MAENMTESRGKTMKRETFARVEWTVDDVMKNIELYGLDATKENARKVLRAAELRIIDAMVNAGWSVIEEALENGTEGR